MPGGTTAKPRLLVGVFCFKPVKHFLYIIHSATLNKFYVGETLDVQNRLKMYNENSFNKSFTKAADDWKLALAFKCRNKNHALYLENFIKRMKSKKFILKIIDQPDILNDIINKK
ncbi:GIY-YIG nuclease family protein [uncultured Mesonia sp.]|uniref:GIY-YIG nuclease family protein n=1 Tax=uncultured Mesonia sp. TaxID=399731 RepID=UPI00374E52E1